MDESEKLLKEKRKPNETAETDLSKALDELPEPVRKQIEANFLSVEMSRLMPQTSPILEKVTPEHITQYLDGAREESRNEFRDRTQNKILIFSSIFFALCFIVILIVLLKDKPEFLEKIISHIAVLIAGAFGGYGIGRKKQSTEN